MKKKLLYDLTTFESTIDCLGEYLGLTENEIGQYLATHKESYSVEGLFEAYKIDYSRLLEFDLHLAGLHVTTNNDMCKTIKEHGLLDLQQALLRDTPLSRYLAKQGVSIDVEKKLIFYNDRTYDISKDYLGIRDSDKDFVSYKLYEDYQINSFLSYDNVLSYGVQVTPEFLQNLSSFLSRYSIESDWNKQNNKCYVIKFSTPFSNFANDVFYTSGDAGMNSEDFEILSTEQIELMKRKWLVYQSLSILNKGLFTQEIKELYGALNFNVSIPYKDILKIYTSAEYEEEYQIYTY